MSKRKIAVITGSRAEYGLLYWLIKSIHEDQDIKLQLIVTGMHLVPEFGMTLNEIEKDGFPVSEKVEMLLASDTAEAVATSMGLGMIGFAKAYARLKPNMIVVLGDRFEVHAAISASIPFKIPVAHIHGGESTEGLIDEPIRHSITKMSHLHFPSTEVYKKRIMQMGENPESIFSFGAPGIDNILKLRLISYNMLCKKLKIPKDKKIGVLTYHPITLEDNTAELQIKTILESILEINDVYWLFSYANADMHGRAITKVIKEFLEKYPEKGEIYPSLGQKLFLSLLKHAAVMVGNSSSGIIEAPTFCLPVVNIGDRQRGRITASNVIDVKNFKKGEIRDAIRKALSHEFRRSLKNMKNPYGDGHTSEKIFKKIKNFPIGEKLIKKSFFEVSR